MSIASEKLAEVEKEKEQLEATLNQMLLDFKEKHLLDVMIITPVYSCWSKPRVYPSTEFLQIVTITGLNMAKNL